MLKKEVRSSLLSDASEFALNGFADIGHRHVDHVDIGRLLFPHADVLADFDKGALLVVHSELRALARFAARVEFLDGHLAHCRKMVSRHFRRIELGFSGTDSLGRLFNQRPYPFLQPAVRRVTPMLPAVFIRSWRRALDGEK